MGPFKDMQFNKINMNYHLVTFFQQHLNLQHAAFILIDHEDAMVATVYKVMLSNGTKLILKIHERLNDYFREIYFLKYFADKLPVPRIVEAVQPDRGTCGAILMEYLPGALLKETEFTTSLAYELGSQLACIHLNRIPTYGDPIQRDHLSNNPRAYFTFKFKEGLDECRNHLPKKLIEQCQSYYDAHLDLLNSVDGPCMVHRDFRPGNLIIYNGKLQGIIDWAGARASFAEEDFCLLEHGGWPNNPNCKKSFLEGYASIRPIPDYKDLMPFLRVNIAIATIGFTVKRGTWKNTHKRIYKFNRHFLEVFLQNVSFFSK